jgi:hypothetical protein
MSTENLNFFGESETAVLQVSLFTKNVSFESPVHLEMVTQKLRTLFQDMGCVVFDIEGKEDHINTRLQTMKLNISDDQIRAIMTECAEWADQVFDIEQPFAWEEEFCVFGINFSDGEGEPQDIPHEDKMAIIENLSGISLDFFRKVILNADRTLPEMPLLEFGKEKMN